MMDTDFVDDSGRQIPVEFQDRSAIRSLLSTPFNMARRVLGDK